MVRGKGPGKWEMIKAIADGDLIKLTVCWSDPSGEKKKEILIDISCLGVMAGDKRPRNAWHLHGYLCRQDGTPLTKISGWYDSKTRTGSLEELVL